jgi:hypothetical protein
MTGRAGRESRLVNRHGAGCIRPALSDSVNTAGHIRQRGRCRHGVRTEPVSARRFAWSAGAAGTAERHHNGRPNGLGNPSAHRIGWNSPGAGRRSGIRLAGMGSATGRRLHRSKSFGYPRRRCALRDGLDLTVIISAERARPVRAQARVPHSAGVPQARWPSHRPPPRKGGESRVSAPISG